MRKVTKQAIDAFLNKQAGSFGNTSVNVTGDATELRLHGNCIATIKGAKLTVSACGWLTNTTKERLNGLPGVSICQKDYQWYLNGKLWDGKPVTIGEDGY